MSMMKELNGEQKNVDRESKSQRNLNRSVAASSDSQGPSTITCSFYNNSFCFLADICCSYVFDN